MTDREPPASVELVKIEGGIRCTVSPGGGDYVEFTAVAKCFDGMRGSQVNLLLPIDSLRDGIPARRIEDWHEDDGNVLWWVKPGRDGGIEGEGPGEPPYAGRPDDSDWPGYHRWWTPLPPYPTVWAPKPPPPPVWAVELGNLRIVKITHLLTGDARYIEIESGLPLKHYEDTARYWMRRLLDIKEGPLA